MTDQAWEADFVRSLMVRLSGEGLDENDDEGEYLGRHLLVLLNAADHCFLHAPAHQPDLQWERPRQRRCALGSPRQRAAIATVWERAAWRCSGRTEKGAPATPVGNR